MQKLITLNEESTYCADIITKKETDTQIKDIRYRKTVNMEKYNGMHALLQEIEAYRKIVFPESIMATYESPTMLNLPLPSVNPNTGVSTFVDYTGYVVSNIQEWSVANLIEDKVLDKTV
jgi:hypothetical protein